MLAIADLRSEPAADPEASGEFDSVQSDSCVVVSTLGLVGNKKHKKVHCVLVGPPASPEAWRTRCTWRFGLSKYACQPELDFRRCDRCSLAVGQNWGLA